jgi:hypothetical protein
MNNTATISPSQRLGELRYAAGVSCGKSTECILKANAVGANPIKRSFNIEAKWEVPNVIFSKNAIAKNGKIAQRKVARRAQPEINRAQP